MFGKIVSFTRKTNFVVSVLNPIRPISSRVFEFKTVLQLMHSNVNDIDCRTKEMNKKSSHYFLNCFTINSFFINS